MNAYGAAQKRLDKQLREHLDLPNSDRLIYFDLAMPNLAPSGWLNIGTDTEDEFGHYWSGLIDEVKVYKQGTKP